MTAKEELAQLEDQFILGEILESDYKDRKKELLVELRNAGELSGIESNITIAEIKDSVGTTFCHVPDGPFLFGPEEEFKDLQCPIYISKFPVTQQQFKAFLSNVDIGYSDEDYAMLELVSPEPDCPASHLSYNDAKEYCRWLRRETNEYYSLPHEIEWEKAARGIDGRFYPWGTDQPSDAYACFQGEKEYSNTVPVGSFAKNNISPYGCIDMVGNVWEWCLDSFDDERDPHILRGGSWCNEVEFSNCVARTYSYPPDKRVDYGGFRIVYLPGDMLDEYHNVYSGQTKGEKGGLNVVSLKQAPPSEKKGESKKSLSGLAAMLDSAAAKAAAKEEEKTSASAAETIEEAPAPAATGPVVQVGGVIEDDDSAQDAMADLLSAAASQYLNMEKKAEGKKFDNTPAPFKPVENLKPVGDAISYRSIDELETEKQQHAEDLQFEVDEAEKDAKEAGEEEPDLVFEDDPSLGFINAKPADISPAYTKIATGVWLLLLLACLAVAAMQFI